MISDAAGRGRVAGAVAAQQAAAEIVEVAADGLGRGLCRGAGGGAGGADDAGDAAGGEHGADERGGRPDEQAVRAVADLGFVDAGARHRAAQPAGEVAAGGEAGDRDPEEPEARRRCRASSSDAPSPGSKEMTERPIAEPKVRSTKRERHRERGAGEDRRPVDVAVRTARAAASAEAGAAGASRRALRGMAASGQADEGQEREHDHDQADQIDDAVHGGLLRRAVRRRQGGCGAAMRPDNAASYRFGSVSRRRPRAAGGRRGRRPGAAGRRRGRAAPRRGRRARRRRPRAARRRARRWRAPRRRARSRRGAAAARSRAASESGADRRLAAAPQASERRAPGAPAARGEHGTAGRIALFLGKRRVARPVVSAANRRAPARPGHPGEDAMGETQGRPRRWPSRASTWRTTWPRSSTSRARSGRGSWPAQMQEGGAEAPRPAEHLADLRRALPHDVGQPQAGRRHDDRVLGGAAAALAELDAEVARRQGRGRGPEAAAHDEGRQALRPQGMVGERGLRLPQAVLPADLRLDPGHASAPSARWTRRSAGRRRSTPATSSRR